MSTVNSTSEISQQQQQAPLAISEIDPNEIEQHRRESLAGRPYLVEQHPQPKPLPSTVRYQVHGLPPGSEVFVQHLPQRPSVIGPDFPAEMQISLFGSVFTACATPEAMADYWPVVLLPAVERLAKFLRATVASGPIPAEPPDDETPLEQRDRLLKCWLDCMDQCDGCYAALHSEAKADVDEARALLK
jgi:hypothetical protein